MGAENLNGLLRRAIMKKKFEKHRIKPKKKKSGRKNIRTKNRWEKQKTK